MDGHRFTLLLAIALLAAACGGDSSAPDPPDADPATAGRTAVARLQPTTDNTARGAVTFIEREHGVLVEASVSGLEEGNHGFHVYSRDECLPADNYGGRHFSPDSALHGPPDAPPGRRHVGDLGNLFSRGGGLAAYSRVDSLVSLRAGPNDIVGRTVVVHRNPDDFTSPDGNAGPVLACGVIRLTAAEDAPVDAYRYETKPVE